MRSIVVFALDFPITGSHFSLTNFNSRKHQSATASETYKAMLEQVLARCSCIIPETGIDGEEC